MWRWISKSVASNFEQQIRPLGLNRFLEIPPTGLTGGILLYWNSCNVDISEKYSHFVITKLTYRNNIDNISFSVCMLNMSILRENCSLLYGIK